MSYIPLLARGSTRGDRNLYQLCICAWGKVLPLVPRPPPPLRQSGHSRALRHPVLHLCPQCPQFPRLHLRRYRGLEQERHFGIVPRRRCCTLYHRIRRLGCSQSRRVGCGEKESHDEWVDGAMIYSDGNGLENFGMVFRRS